MGICEVLFIILLILKVSEIITCSWWIVTAVIWVPLLLFTAISISMILLKNFCSSKPRSLEYYEDLIKDQIKMKRVTYNTKKKTFESKDVPIFPEKKKFSLSRWWKEGCEGPTIGQKIKNWWVEGNKKAKEKKIEKKEKST